MHRVLLNNLYALAGLFEAPVFLPRIAVHFAQRRESLPRSLEDLTDQILSQVDVVPSTASIGRMFSGSIEPNRSRYDPCLRNFVENPA